MVTGMNPNTQRVVVEMPPELVAEAHAVAEALERVVPSWASTNRSAVLREAIRLGLVQLRAQAEAAVTGGQAQLAEG
jgi:metal-responsive CopG/Arc/MetJ family transcriptional regulator